MLTGSEAFRAGTDVAATVRAVVEAQACRLRLHSSWIADRTESIRVTGGASVNTALCQVLADVFNARLERLETENSAGLGAALRAAQAAGAADWASLTAAFCRPAAGQSVSPIPANVETYRRHLPRFAEFARR